MLYRWSHVSIYVHFTQHLCIHILTYIYIYYIYSYVLCLYTLPSLSYILSIYKQNFLSDPEAFNGNLRPACCTEKADAMLCCVQTTCHFCFF